MNPTASFYISGNPEAIPVTLEKLDGSPATFRAAWTNTTGIPVRAEQFLFDDFRFDVPGERIRLYCESWSAVSAAGTHRYGETGFNLSPVYLPNATSNTAAYKRDTPNYFTAENTVVLNDRDTGNSLLIGFISMERFNNRFIVELAENGVKRLHAFNDCDGCEVAPGETIVSEEFIILEGKDGYGLLEQYADVWGKRMNARLSAEIPTGWCSWYYYFRNITEQAVIENLDWLKAHRQEFPIRYFQLDDGYQTTPGDWLEPSERFPHGLEYSIRKMAEAGFVPGVWFGPFMVGETSKLFQEHPEYLLRDKDGNILTNIRFNRRNMAVLDCSRDDVCDYLRALFARIRSFGCRYIKLDFMIYESTMPGAVYHDPKATRISAYRRGMQAIRDGIGEDAFMLGGTVLIGPSVGIVDGSRYGSDIPTQWCRESYHEAPTVPNVTRNIICRRYMHKRLFITDPDVHIARKDNNELTGEEVLYWTTALYMIGGAMLLADRFSTLDPERAKLSQLLLQRPDPFRDVRPVDFFEREIPVIWRGIRDEDDAPALGFFNAYDTPLSVTTKLADAGFSGQKGWTDFWSKADTVCDGETLTVTLEPHTARLLIARP